MRYRVDQGAPHCVALGVCDCGSRFLAVTRRRALERLAEHEAREHPQDHHVRGNLAAARRADLARVNR